MTTAKHTVLRRAALLAAVLALAAGALLWKARQSPEWVVLFGDDAARAMICRSVWQKPAPRARWSLRRLLHDPEASVQQAALEALSRRPELDRDFAGRVAELAQASTPDVRARALVYLLQRPGGAADAWVDRACAELADAGFRHSHPELLQLALRGRLARNGPEAVAWAWALVLADPLQPAAPLRPLLENPEWLRPLRSDTLARLDAASDSQRDLMLRMLTAMDGRMRGHVAADWAEGSAPESAPVSQPAVDRFTVEAEWAYDIRPNYQVEQHHGEWCLHLTEGAGGYITWAGRDNSSVDIGSASLPFTLDRDGDYQLWLRVWFDDKCGNSTGIAVDGQPLGVSFPDWERTRFQVWYWDCAVESVHLAKGRHTLELTAWEDGVCIDKYALLPKGEPFDADRPPPPSPLYAPDRPGSISLTTDMQMQPRGTTQKLTVWVRRQAADVPGGTVELSLPPPFATPHGRTAEVVFPAGSPVARTTFLVEVPPDAPGGEHEVTAVFAAGGKQLASGRMVLGIPFDWWTTGSLDPHGARAQALQSATRLPDADRAAGWVRYPPAGFDRYRRFAFEQAYGESADAIVFLATRIDVAEPGDYVSLLTIDDCGHVFIDGREVAGRDHNGASEGSLQTRPLHLDAGRHDVYAWVYQQPGQDEYLQDGPVKKPNRWACKWLLRKDRHTPAPEITGPVLAAP